MTRIDPSNKPFENPNFHNEPSPSTFNDTLLFATLELEMTRKVLQSIAEIHSEKVNETLSVNLSSPQVVNQLIDETLQTMDAQQVNKLLTCCNHLTVEKAEDKIKELMRRITHPSLSPSDRAISVMDFISQSHS